MGADRVFSRRLVMLVTPHMLNRWTGTEKEQGKRGGGGHTFG